MKQRALLQADQAESLLLSNEVQTSEAGIVSRTVLQSPELRVVLFAFAEGQELTTHTSSRRAIVQILEGTCSFLYAGAWHVLERGALLHMPPGHSHAVKASHGNFSMLLTLSSEPSQPSSS